MSNHYNQAALETQTRVSVADMERQERLIFLEKQMRASARQSAEGGQGYPPEGFDRQREESADRRFYPDRSPASLGPMGMGTASGGLPGGIERGGVVMGELLVPLDKVSLVIGSKGSIINEISRKTSAVISIIDDDVTG